MTSEPALRISNLRYALAERQLFDGLDLLLPAGSSTAILGPSGSGKSTLLSCVLGLVSPDSGSIRVGVHEISGASRSRIAKLRADAIGMVFQFGELLPELSPVENVALAALLAGKRDKGVYDRAEALLGELGVPRADSVATLSGGERQRTAVARALINHPSLLLADEPTGSLDAANRVRVAQMLFQLPRKHGCGLLVATHDFEIAKLADAAYTIQSGRLTKIDAATGGR
ncbi:ABC transporter ATP-binding protein [Glycomyces paridis]|uniref:ABC transporter ATP-binding protein n=1 Tax=Glycomyces paridis TaxID=2126555 RepID=A0A4S8PJS9_9ACTN|nr:ABC transporter ATP-binding protein [Glycomyces paridis]THV30015.1 ABC transporter ATP-binding protein [Glycomyces paridis]